MKRLLLGLIVGLSVVIAGIFSVLSTPQKVSRIEFKIYGDSEHWKEKISQYVFSLVSPGEEMTPEKLEILKEQICKLPWIKNCKLSTFGNVLKIEIEEEKPKFAIFYKGKTFLIGKKGFVLSRVDGKTKLSPLYYYRGKIPPFTAAGEFLRVKNTIKLEIELLKERLPQVCIDKEKPEVILTDVGVVLVFRKHKVIAYLSSNPQSWKNFVELKRKLQKIPAGTYDLRYNGMLIRGRRENA